MDPVTLNADTLSLDEWIERHGPLSPASALIIVLDACAAASRLEDRSLAAVIRSLNPAGIMRGREGAWSWTPTIAGQVGGRVGDGDVIERLGAILFHAFTGQAVADPFADEHALRRQLRALRPDLADAVANLTVGALAARRARGTTLKALAHDIRQVLGVETKQAHRYTRRTRRLLAGAMVLLAGLSAVSWMTVRGNQSRLESDGFTAEETALHDVTTEEAATYALINEHTGALELYQELQRTWSERVSIDDPRLAWTRAHEAWVRLLSGDRFTARQLLEGLPDWLTRELGDRHPYTRAVKLGLSHTIDPRGSDAEAASLRAEAERATRDLIRGTVPESQLLSEIPMAPGVVAHLAPNAPEREGFRRLPDGDYLAPLTSIQRLISGRNGWRLHMIAGGSCRAWVVVGTVPRLVSVKAEREDQAWRVIVEGTTRVETLRSSVAGNVGVSLIADGSGALTAMLGNERRELTLDTTSQTPVPPYGLGFSDEPTTGCTLVWLELPVPPRETVGPRPKAPSVSPGVLVQHVGRTDPTSEGFIDRGGMDASAPVWNDLDGRTAWQITGRGCCSYLYHPVDGSALFAGGWRFRGIVRIGRGSGHASIILDTGVDHPRFDINLAAVGRDAVINLPGSALSYRVPGAANRWLDLELRYSPESARASLFVDGVQRLTGYKGWRWYRESRGLTFGTGDVTANFSLVRLEAGRF